MKAIVIEPNPILHQRAREVPQKKITSKYVQHILHEMEAVLRKTPEGIGIAAPQIGYDVCIFLASEEAQIWDKLEEMPKEERKKKQWKYHVFINPAILRSSKNTLSDVEGCLSVPRTYGLVRRAEKITVSAYDEQGKKFQRGTSKLYARVMQHEIDHLNGILFTEKAKNIKVLDRAQKQN